MTEDRALKAEKRALGGEKQELLDALERGHAALRRALEGVDEALAGRKPAGGGWSIVECVEHVVVSEQYLLTRLRSAERCEEGAAQTADLEREAKIAARAANRMRRIEAPSASQPQGRYASLREAVAAFEATRAETVAWVEEFGGDLRGWTTDHPLFAGPVTCQETLIMMAAHPGRHAEQIGEVRTALEG
jgi:hypothetical protein